MTQDKFSDEWIKNIIYSKMYGGSTTVSHIQPLFWKQRLEKSWIKANLVIEDKYGKECKHESTEVQYQSVRE